MKTFTIGLGTYRALVATFSPCREWVATEDDPQERALYQARLDLIDRAKVTAWKAYLPVPVDPDARALLAIDLLNWADASGLILEFETTGPNEQVRLAFRNLATKLSA